MPRVSNDDVAMPSRIGVHSSGKSCDHVGIAPRRRGQELVEPGERRVDDIVQHHHRPRLLVDAVQRVVDPTGLVTPIAGQHVPQHARVSLRAQRGGSVRAHQAIVDHSTRTIRSKQQSVAAGLVDRSARAVELFIDRRVVGRTELHRVRPGVAAQHGALR